MINNRMDAIGGVEEEKKRSTPDQRRDWVYRATLSNVSYMLPVYFPPLIPSRILHNARSVNPFAVRPCPGGESLNPRLSVSTPRKWGSPHDRDQRKQASE